MSYLLDTNVISELRKSDRANPNVVRWFDEVDDAALFSSVLVAGELRKGVERLRRRDAEAAVRLDAWLARLWAEESERFLPITREIAEVWGQLNAGDPLPVIDSLLAATAHVHGLIVVTRTMGDLERCGVPLLNPFQA